MSAAAASLLCVGALLLATASAHPFNETVMHLQMLNGTMESGAVCLDGTPGGFYFSAATAAANTNDWQIYFQGGGWCYDEIDCWGRSSTVLGSSAKWAKNGTLGGILSSDCARNPDFCNFNRVWLVYCDGNSFSGDRSDAVPVRGLDGKVKPLYFRGRRILDATLKALHDHYGLGNARNVHLTGCSAGGLATFLHTDYVHAQLKTRWATALEKFKASPISGFFLEHDNVHGEAVYPEEMQSIFELANSTHGLNAACIAAHQSTGDTWRCNFAQHAYAYTTSPIMPLNSALDSWQTTCIYTSELVHGFPNQNTTANGACAAVHGWKNCSHDPETCSPLQMEAMNRYIGDFQATLSTLSGPTYHRAGNGAFIHSCHTHCEAQGDDFFTFAVDGVTMQQAVSKWWNAQESDPAHLHSYTPCYYNLEKPHRCNPTCWKNSSLY